MLLLSGYVRNEATLAAEPRPAAEAGRDHADLGPAARAADRRPRLPRPARRARLRAFAQDDEPDDEFVFGLERVLDGVAALVALRS